MQPSQRSSLIQTVCIKLNYSEQCSFLFDGMLIPLNIVAHRRATIWLATTDKARGWLVNISHVITCYISKIALACSENMYVICTCLSSRTQSVCSYHHVQRNAGGEVQIRVTATATATAHPILKKATTTCCPCDLFTLFPCLRVPDSENSLMGWGHGMRLYFPFLLGHVF